MTLVANFYGGPGSGKSTLCAAVFADLKFKGINCEMALEWVKEAAWEGRRVSQTTIFENQWRRVQRLLGKVDVILTDSPLALSHIYGETQPDWFHDLVWRTRSQLDTIDFFIERTKPYNPIGRYQTFEEAKALDARIWTFLTQEGYPKNLYTVYGERSGVDLASGVILGRLDG